MQLGFYFDQTRCTGCDTCVVACKDWQDVPAGLASWIRIKENERGQYPDLSVSYLFVACFHCANPTCVRSCPVNAIAKRAEDGIVIVDRDLCLGGEACRFACQRACPYGAPQFGEERNAKMQKCNFCMDRWTEDKKPICVASCPMRALDAGPLDELRARYGKVQKAEGFSYRAKLKPSVIFKPKH